MLLIATPLGISVSRFGPGSLDAAQGSVGTRLRLCSMSVMCAHVTCAKLRAGGPKADHVAMQSLGRCDDVGGSSLGFCGGAESLPGEVWADSAQRRSVPHLVVKRSGRESAACADRHIASGGARIRMPHISTPYHFIHAAQP